MKALLKAAAPFLILLACLALAVIALHAYRTTAYDEGFAVAKTHGEAALDKLKAEYAQERQAQAEAGKGAAERAAQALAAEVQRGNELALALDAKKAELRTTTERLTGEVARVTTLYRRARDAQPEPLPAAVFTLGYGRLWNEALGLAASGIGTGLSASAASGRADAQASGAATPDDLASTLTPALLLANHIRNGETASACRAQLNALIDWNTTHGRH
ncbi:DNA-packaging protein [Pseudomonas oryzihabitans]|uniref:DNA-packaging protein n=1 Tax=Pseudomonas oryzihabitans TaxID=47885 RepID=UPI00289BAE83|nr:DNA-packaging protein [Pseudomonas oryzihabitans]